MSSYFQLGPVLEGSRYTSIWSNVETIPFTYYVKSSIYSCPI